MLKRDYSGLGVGPVQRLISSSMFALYKNNITILSGESQEFPGNVVSKKLKVPTLTNPSSAARAV